MWMLENVQRSIRGPHCANLMHSDLDGSTIQVIQQPLSGVVWDEGHEPLAGVEVVLPEFKLVTTTDRHGA